LRYRHPHFATTVEFLNSFLPAKQPKGKWAKSPYLHQSFTPKAKQQSVMKKEAVA
jgi:hypothetical protein